MHTEITMCRDASVLLIIYFFEEFCRVKVLKKKNESNLKMIHLAPNRQESGSSILEDQIYSNPNPARHAQVCSFCNSK